MKKQHILPAILLTLLSIVSVRAQSTYTPGDSFLFFSAQSGTGATKNVQIDLGNLSSSSFTSFNLSSSSLSSILGTTYGNNWYTLNTLSWGLVGSANANVTDASNYNLFGTTLGNTGANAAGPALDFGAIFNIGSTLDTMYTAGISPTATQSTLTDNNGVSHYYSIYDSTIGGSASSLDAIGFNFFPGPLSGDVPTFSNNAIMYHAVADDGDGNPVATTTVQTGTFSVSSGAISIAAYSAAPSGTNLWSAGSGNLSAIGITNNSNLVFSGSGGAVTNNNQVSSLSGINFSNSATGSYTLSGSNLAIGSGGIVNSSSYNQTVSNNLTITSAQSFIAASNNLAIGGSINNGGYALSSTGSQTLTISGSITGAGSFTQSGTGKTLLTGSSSFDGNTVVSSGTLVLSGYTNTSSALSVAGASTLSVVGIDKVSSLVLSNNSALNMTVDRLNGSSQLATTGNIVLTNGVAGTSGDVLTLLIKGQYNDKTKALTAYQLFQVGGSITGNFKSVVLDSSGDITGSLTFFAVNNMWQLWSSPASGLNPSSYVGLNMTTGNLTVIPEPSTYALMLVGLILIVGIRRRLA